LSKYLKLILLIILIPLVFSGCTVTCTFYLLNKSPQSVEITIKLNRIYEGIETDYIVRIEDLNNRRMKKITYFSYEEMHKKLVKIDSFNKEFKFKLNPNEFAFIGRGANSRLMIVSKLEIKSNQGLLVIDPSKYDEFEIYNSGLMKCVGTKIIE
jgi:hypothetical protein